MQELSPFSSLFGLPKFGDALSQLRRWESRYREIAQRRNFTEVNLPIIAPLEKFRSMLSGDDLLPPGPRFTDGDGVQWALRSDMTGFTTQFVLEHASEITFPARVAYSGKVFSYLSPRASGPGRRFGGHFRESQLDDTLEGYEYGAEIIGMREIDADLEILRLATETAESFGYEGLTFVFGDARISQALIAHIQSNSALANKARKLETLRDALCLVDFQKLGELFSDVELKKVFEEALKQTPYPLLAAEMKKACPQVTLVFDPWLTRPQSFYSGLTFEIFVRNRSQLLQRAGAGGRYDTLYSHFSRDLPAVGFMIKDPNSAKIDLPMLSTPIPSNDVAVKSPGRCLRIAIPKGRMTQKILQTFASVGLVSETDISTTRKLVLKSKCGTVEFLLVKNSDVTSYLEQGVADIAIAGSDVLDEHPASVFRPVTFNFGECRICLAGKPEKKDTFIQLQRPKVASKYVGIAKRELADLGVSCEILPLQGSVELASVIDMADAIVDLVETGSTLRDNGLIIYRELARTRMQLAVTRGFYYSQNELLKNWMGVWKAESLLSGPHSEALEETI